MTDEQHIFKYWEAWLIGPEDARFYRYIGFEILPTGGFTVCQRQVHQSTDTQPPDPNTVLALRSGLTHLRKGPQEPDHSITYASMWSAIAAWDQTHPQAPAKGPSPNEAPGERA